VRDGVEKKKKKKEGTREIGRDARKKGMRGNVRRRKGFEREPIYFLNEEDEHATGGPGTLQSGQLPSKSRVRDSRSGGSRSRSKFSRTGEVEEEREEDSFPVRCGSGATAH
jgi:hypothetical protein